jgi:hypothetical protein
MAQRKPGRSSRRGDSSNTALDAEKRRLQEEASRIQDQLERNRKVIEDAPKLKERVEKRRREELVQRRSAADTRFGSLIDRRHGLEVNVGAAVRERKLRKHQRQGMWTFFVLCLVLCGVLYWIYAVVIRGLTP